MHIHSNIRVLRRKTGLTQGQLAQQIGKTQVTVGDYERGNAIPPLPVILQLCDIFQVDLQTLVLHDLVQHGFATATSQRDDIQNELQTQQRINRLQEQRLAELEREIQEHAPELARRLGLLRNE